MKGKMFVITSIVIIGSLFTGCSESTNFVSAPKITNVSGKVIGNVFNLGLPYVKVRVEDKNGYQNTITDIYGNFYANNVQVPYVVYITDTVTKSGSLFLNLSNSECWLPHYRFDGSTAPSSVISVDLSGVTGNSNDGKAFFTDGKNVNGTGGPGDLQVYLPDNQPVTGKVSVLLYTKDNNGAVTSYDKFGYMDNVTISPNGNTNLVFTDSILNYVPSKSLITGTITGLPPNMSTGYSHFFISMSPRKSYNYLDPSHIFFLHGISFNFYIPSNLPEDYYPLLKILVSDSSSAGAYTSYVNYLLPKTGATGLNIKIPTIPQNIVPSELSLVDSNTLFSFPDYFGTQIYHVVFTDSIKTFHIYTNSPSTSLWFLSRMGLGSFAPNSRITMTVNTIGGFRYEDEYVNPNFKNIEQYTSQPAVRHYIMKP
jgi:hypothetical protein